MKIVKITIALFLVLLFIGCATQQPHVYKDKPKENKFTEINLFVVSKNRYINRFEAELINYIYNSVESSNLFAKVQSDEIESPFSVKVKYWWTDKVDAGEMTNMMVSAASLFVIPTYKQELHNMEIKVYYKGKVVKTINETKKAKLSHSMFKMITESRKEVINEMLKNFFAKIESEKIIPTVMEMKEYAKPTDTKISL